MDEARKLLDSLMGQTRNQDLTEAKQTKGKNFTQESVCKFYLLGFCPVSELAESKMAGKRNISDCVKVHSDAMKAEYEQHPEKDKYKAEYEKALLPVLEGLVREADAWVARERANVQKTGAGPEKVTTNNMSPSVKEQYETLKEDMNKMMAAAEAEAEKGNVDGSKFKVVLADEIKSKVKELEEKYIVTYNVKQNGEEVCEICGTRYEALTATNHARYNAHFKGKVHLAYVQIRDWIKDLRQKSRQVERRPTRDGSREREKEKDRERRRSRSRRRRSRSKKSQERGREREKEREKEKERWEKEKEKEKERDRERDRGKERDRERRRRD